MREVDWKGDSGLSRRVAEISASIICPGVISMGIPRSGVGGRGGVVGREMREPRLESDTGEVGRLTVTGTLELRVRLKQKDGLEFITPGGEGWTYLLVGMVGVVVKVLAEAATGLTASILRPSAEETTTSLCTVPAGTTIL